MFITEDPIELDRFCAISPPPDCGGTVLFVGRVRNHHEGKKVLRLFYESYHSMAEKEIQKIIDDVRVKSGANEIRVIHRTGWLEVGDIAVVISASGAHREEAFTACRGVIDRIKRDVPIWKKEIYEDSTHSWVICKHNKEEG